MSLPCRTVPFEPAAIAEAVERDGFTVVDRVLDPARVATMKAELDGILASTPTGRNDFEGFGTRRIYRLFGKTRIFDDLAVHPVMLGVLERILGPSQLERAHGHPDRAR